MKLLLTLYISIIIIAIASKSIPDIQSHYLKDIREKQNIYDTEIEKQKRYENALKELKTNNSKLYSLMKIDFENTINQSKIISEESFNIISENWENFYTLSKFKLKTLPESYDYYCEDQILSTFSCY